MSTIIPSRYERFVDTELNSETTEVNLSGYGLCYFPMAVLACPKLTYLNISNNKIAEIPADIAKLTDLQHLFADDNLLETIPPEVGSLRKLTTLRLRRNRLHTLPAELGQLMELMSVTLDDNCLTELSSLCNLPKLMNLSYRNNPIAIPVTIDKDSMIGKSINIPEIDEKITLEDARALIGQLEIIVKKLKDALQEPRVVDPIPEYLIHNLEQQRASRKPSTIE